MTKYNVEVILSPEVRTRALQALVDSNRIGAGIAAYRAWKGPCFKEAVAYGVSGGVLQIHTGNEEYLYPAHAWERVKVTSILPPVAPAPATAKAK